MNLNIKAMAIAFGLVWGISLFVITWCIILLEGSSDTTTFIGKFYIGYSLTPVGSLIGLMWGIIDGAIGGVMFGWLYNRFNN
jgi:hypothetical protein